LSRRVLERKYIPADERAFDSGQTRTGTASIAGTEAMARLRRRGDRVRRGASWRPSDRKACRCTNTGEPTMSGAITKEVKALVETASEMFEETGCVPGIDGEEVRAETMVPDAKEYISESIDNPEVPYDPQILNTPGFTLVLSWLAQKWLRKCHKLAPRGNKNPEQYLTKEQKKGCPDSAAAELIREIAQQRPLN